MTNLIKQKQTEMSETPTKPKKSKSGLIIIAILIAIFALPEIIAVSLQMMKWRPDSTTNHGDLIQPARPISDLEFQTIDNKTEKFSSFHKKWVMVYFAEADCDDACVKNLYLMRQVKTALGKEQERVQRVFIQGGQISPEKTKILQTEFAGMSTLVGPKQNVDALSSQFILPNMLVLDTTRIYLIDPLGNLMMSYRDNPDGMRKDLVHLMKISWSG